MKQRAVSKSNIGGFPTVLDRQSPKKVFPAGARDVNVGCRNGFEASCLHDRGHAARRVRGRDGERSRRPPVRTGMAGVSKRQGCSGQVKVERLFAGPSVMVSGEQVGPSASFKSDPWKARGISLPWSSNQAPRRVGSRLSDRRRGSQGIAGSDRRVTSRARGAASSCAPSA